MPGAPASGPLSGAGGAMGAVEARDGLSITEVLDMAGELQCLGKGREVQRMRFVKRWRGPGGDTRDGRHRRELTFEGVNFAYSPAHPVLHDINLKIEFGETIGRIHAECRRREPQRALRRAPTALSPSP